MVRRLLRGNTPNSFNQVRLADGTWYNTELLNKDWVPARDPRRLLVMHNGRVVRIQTAAGDHGDLSEQTTLNERTELLTAGFRYDQTDKFAQFDQDFWLSFGLFVAEGDRFTADYNIILQMHGVQGTLGVNRQPPFVLVLGPQSDQQFADGKANLTLQTRHSDPVAATAVNVPSTTRWGADINRGQWYDILCRMRYSLTGGGQIDLWLDKVKQNTGPQNFNFGYNEPGAGGAGYMQFGQYRHFAPETCVEYFSDMEQGNTSLASRLTTDRFHPEIGPEPEWAYATSLPPVDNPPPAAAGKVLNYQTDFLTTAKKRVSGVMQDTTFAISPNFSVPPADSWLSCFPYGRIVNNNEAGLYADPTIHTGVDPFPIVDGVRTLQTGLITNGNGYIDNAQDNHRYRHYASLISSRWAFTVTDGDYVEVDMAFPGVFGNQGQWPAFWFLAAAALGATNIWPPEIDTLEWPQMITGANNRRFWNNLHRRGKSALPMEIDFQALGISGNVGDRHRYGTKITAAEIEHFVDDISVRKVANDEPGMTWYVILNLALGGNWPNNFIEYPLPPAGSDTYPNGTPPTPNAQTSFPGTMKLYGLKHYKAA